MVSQPQNAVNGQRMKDNMYTPINGAHCFRRLNGTHVTGCSSKNGGSVGVLHMINSKADIDFLVQKHPSPPYAPIVPPALFTRENILRLRNEAGPYVSVLLLMNNASGLQQFSQESRCPNQYSGLSSVFKLNSDDQRCSVDRAEDSWNPWGSGLLLEDFPFPIFYVADVAEMEKLIECYEKFNAYDLDRQHQRSLCAIEVKAFMSAAVSTDICMRRSNTYNSLIPATKFCDPLQGKNVYATLFPRPVVPEEQRVEGSERIVLVSARTDTTTMFDGWGLGAMDSVVPFSVLISVAHFLAQVLPSNDRNVLFVFFNGESYDYIGSQRFVFDLQTGAFPSRSTQTKPISMDNIELMIDIGSLDDLTDLQVYHAAPQPMATKIAELLRKINLSYDFGIQSSQPILTGNLPPVSAQSFLRENITFPAVIIASRPGNRFYHSIYDDLENLNYRYGNHSSNYNFTQLESLDLGDRSELYGKDSIQMRIRNASTLIGMSIYELLVGRAYDQRNGTNSVLIDEFLHCFLESSDCPLFRATLKPDAPRVYPAPPSRYISVHTTITADATGWTYRVLALLLGRKVENATKADCAALHYPYQWMAGYGGGGECRRTTQNMSLALSPAFLNETYDFTSYRYSTWTESTWSEMSARIFLRPSPWHETLTLSIGIVVMVISFVLVFLINSRSDVLFNQSSSPKPIVATQPTQC
ncbi:nicastrin [Anopheles nili]|uniref:nicastrin n=1 Tax=Anopheles nili TaxID=185578 RepID=UPI00237A1D9B|nr:nicastrin [Anopheles nili]